MTTKERVQLPNWPAMDVILSALLALFLVGGLVGALYLHQAARRFVVESQLPIFPAAARPAEELPPPVELPGEAPVAGEGLPVESLPSTPTDEQPPSEEAEGAPLIPAEESGDVAPPRATERLTLLVMGIDRRPGEEGPWRTDSMIVLSIDPASNSVAMLSFPRDLFITIPDYGYGEHRDRINTAFVYGESYEYPGGGPALAKQTVRRNFGIEVDRYLVMDFNGFRQMVDYIGGIEVTVPELLVDREYPTEDYGIMTVRFEAGRQTMDGQRALIYSRTRKSTSDFARAARQQEVILAVRDKILSLDIIPSLTPANLARLIATVNRSIMTDMTPDEVLAFAQVARDIEDRDISQLVIDSTMIYPYITYQGAEVLLPNWEEILPRLEETFGMELLSAAPMAPLPPPLPTATPILPTRVPRATAVPFQPTREPQGFATWTPTREPQGFATWTPVAAQTQEPLPLPLPTATP